jgi:hypothetical protein
MNVLKPLVRETDDPTFDDTRVDAVAAFGQPLTGEVMEQAGQQRRMTRRVSQLKFSQGVLHNTQCTDKIQAVEIEVSLERGFVHEHSHEAMADQDGKQFFDDAARFETAQRMIDEALMHPHFVQCVAL